MTAISLTEHVTSANNNRHCNIIVIIIIHRKYLFKLHQINIKLIYAIQLVNLQDNNTHFTTPCLGLPGWAGTRRDIRPLTSIVTINHPLSTFSIYYNPLCSIYVLDSLFASSLSRSSLVYLLVWNPPLQAPYVSSPRHCLLFATDAHTIATSFAVVLRLCHLFLISLSTLTYKIKCIKTNTNVVSQHFLSQQLRSSRVEREQLH